MATKEQCIEVCNLVAESKGHIDDKCKEVGISTKSFYKMIVEDEELGKHYTRAKEAQADILFDSFLDVANEPVPSSDRGLDSAAVQDKRVRLDAIKWYLTKAKPKKYGDTLDLTSGGERLPEPPREIIYKVKK